ncbi:MAG: hypothetical protein ABIJ97_12410 [Bacteroidota bacterium]
MKKFKLLLTMAVMLLIAGCNKYEEGPYFSVLTKNARVTGEWELVEYNNIQSTSDATSTYTFDGNMMTFSGKYYNGWEYIDTTFSNPYSLNVTIEGDGTYEWNSTENGAIYKRNSTWTWLDGKTEKEQLSFKLNGNYIIQKLSNNEMILFTFSNYENNSGGSFYFSNSESIYTFEKK